MNRDTIFVKVDYCIGSSKLESQSDFIFVSLCALIDFSTNVAVFIDFLIQ